MGNSGVELQIDSKLNEFTIKRVLGAGTFGITYLAEDNYLNKLVVIKEYFPNDIAVRKNDDTIAPKSKDDIENFQYGLDSFLKEAQTLAKFNHPNIVRINSFCKSNNTAYFIMDYEEGEDLELYLQRNPQLSEDEILAIILPLLDGLKEVHNKSYLHRDIKPGNIYMKSDGSPMLIDFGATRYSIGVKSQSLSIILTPGYAPKEQYSSKSKQEPYTDIYAIGAVMYKMVTDATPIEASERANAITDDEPDPHIKLMEMNYPQYSDNLKKAIDWAMEFKPKDRPQSVKEFQDALINRDKNIESIQTVKKEKSIKQEKSKKTQKEEQSTESKNNSSLIVGLFAVILLIGGSLFVVNNNKSDNSVPTENRTTPQYVAQNSNGVSRENSSNPIRQSAKIKEEDIYNFLRELYRVSESDDVYKILNFYTFPIKKYFSISNATRNDVLIDRKRFNKKWTDRDYRINSIKKVNSYGDTHIVDVDFIYSVENSTKKTSGRAISRYTLKEKDGKLSIIKVEEKSILHNDVVTKVDFNKKKVLRYSNDNLNLTLSYPLYVKRGSSVHIQALLENNGEYESRGGITLSFPQLSDISGRVISNNFNTNIKTYGYSDKIWSKTLGEQMYAKYLMVESNDEKWNPYEKHDFEIAIDAPDSIDKFKILVRAALRDRVVPGSGEKDQQGYPCKKIIINIVD